MAVIADSVRMKFDAYIKKSLKNALIDYVRKDKRYHDKVCYTEDVEEYIEVNHLGEKYSSKSAEAESIDNQLERLIDNYLISSKPITNLARELHNDKYILEFLSKLNQTEEEVFWRSIHGQSIPEIAEYLTIQTKDVYTINRRIKRKLSI